MPSSEFELIGPQSESASWCHVAEFVPGRFRVSVDLELLGEPKCHRTLFLVGCSDHQREAYDSNTLCFRNLIWGYSFGDSGEHITIASLRSDADAYPPVESITKLRELDEKHNPHENSPDGRFTFELTKDEIIKSYVCLEFCGPVLDGGLYATFDLPKYAKQ